MPRTTNSHARQVAPRLKNYPDNYLKCRAIHPWISDGFYETRDNMRKKLIVEVWHCPSCTGTKREWTDPKTGQVIHREYDRADGYDFVYDPQERADGAVVTRRDCRLERINRANVYTNEDAYNQAHP